MTVSERPFTVWMRRATSETTGPRFLDRATSDYREARTFDPKKVISGVGRGFALLRNARKWSQPSVGAGSSKAMEARGRQWRLVMAYGGFEIFAKAHMCHFREAGSPHVSHFVEIAQRKHPTISNHRFPLPIVKNCSGKVIARGKSLVLEGKADGRFWNGWLQGGAATVDAIHAAQLARVVRNLSAHGVLSPDLAIELNAVALCDALVSALVTIAGEVIKNSVARTEV